MRVDEILQRLQKVKRKGLNKWVAACPAHNDKHPSLAITEVENRTLLHCFSGCLVHEICIALNLTTQDLFIDSKKTNQKIPGVSKRELLKALELEQIIVALCESQLEKEQMLNQKDIQRGLLALERIDAVKGLSI